MTSSSSGTSSPCKSKMDCEVVCSRPNKCVLNYQLEKKHPITFLKMKKEKRKRNKKSKMEGGFMGSRITGAFINYQQKKLGKNNIFALEK